MADKTLDDYREILAGWEEDLKASEQRVESLLNDLAPAYRRLAEDRVHVQKMKEMIAEVEKLTKA